MSTMVPTLPDLTLGPSYAPLPVTGPRAQLSVATGPHRNLASYSSCVVSRQHDGMDLRSTDNIIIETNADNTDTSLTIVKVGMRDGGVYSVVTENPHGETTANGVLLLRSEAGVTAGQGRAGQGTAGQDRAGQGRTGQDRAG